MACGVPVVAYGLGGFTDTVVDGVTGHLVPPRDPHALATTLRRLLREPSRRMAYATAPVDRARSCYSWRRPAEHLPRLSARLAPLTPQPGGARRPWSGTTLPACSHHC